MITPMGFRPEVAEAALREVGVHAKVEANGSVWGVLSIDLDPRVVHRALVLAGSGESFEDWVTRKRAEGEKFAVWLGWWGL